MTKAQLQKELLEKIKPGTKPSDLKKGKALSETKKPKKPAKKPVLSPSIEIDEGYESDNSTHSIPTALPLPNQAIKTLQKEITSLKRQLQVYKDFKDADLKIKEKLKGENEELKKTISDLKNQGKNTENIKEPRPIKTFPCSDCHQTKPQTELSRQFSNFSFCLTCSKKARQAATEQKQPTPQPQLFTCVACETEKHEIPIYKKVDIPYNLELIKGQPYPVCSSCLPHIKEYNEHEAQVFSIGED